MVAIFSEHLYTGRGPKLYGHGTPTRDYVYVGDVVSALLAAVGTLGHLQLATGVETDVMTIWSELSATAGEEIEPELADLRPGELSTAAWTSRAPNASSAGAQGADRGGPADDLRGAGRGIPEPVGPRERPFGPTAAAAGDE